MARLNLVPGKEVFLMIKAVAIDRGSLGETIGEYEHTNASNKITDLIRTAVVGRIRELGSGRQTV